MPIGFHRLGSDRRNHYLYTMSATSHFIRSGDQNLHYLQYGSGARLLLAFHGYGHDAASFEVLMPFLQKQYTIFCIDLPHHGQTDWATGKTLSIAALAALTRELMHKHGTGKVSLLGYSLGGRVCFSIVEQMPECIDKVTLLATDGLTINTYYYFFTNNPMGKMIFKGMLTFPGMYLPMVTTMKAFGALNDSQYKFVMHYLNNKEAREQLGQRWPALSELIPNPEKLRKVIQDHAIPVSIVMGQYDRIMPPGLAEKFKTGLETVQLHILPKGHRIFDDGNAAEIAQSLL